MGFRLAFITLLIIGAFSGIKAFGQVVVDSNVIKLLEGTESQTISRKADVIILLKDPVSLNAPLELRRQKVAEIQGQILSEFTAQEFQVGIRYHLIPGLAGTIHTEGLEKLKGHPLVTGVELDIREFVLLDAKDPLFPLRPELNESRPLIKADQAHSSGFTGAGIAVAVLDDGIDTDHPDLVSDLIEQHCTGSCPYGSNSAEGGPHGTKVSGIITSEGTIAPLGIAPDAKLVAVRVTDEQGFAYKSWIAAGIDWVTNNKASIESEHNVIVGVINMSLGFDLYPGTCDSQSGTLAYSANLAKAQGITLFAASGNDGSGTLINDPACLSSVVAVTSTYDDDVGSKNFPDIPCTDNPTYADKVVCQANSNSNIDVTAPGCCIDTTGNGASVVYSSNGTSIASPHAAAVATLVLQADSNLSPDEIESILEDTGVTVTDPKNNLTFPRVDALGAVTGALLKMEIGEVTIDQNWETVTLSRSFNNPVVIAKPLSYADTEPALVRVRNVTSNSFQIRVQEWDYLDDIHGFELADYIVTEQGHFSFPDGTEIEARTIETNATSSFAQIDFLESFSSTPIVLTTIMSFNDAQAVVTRVKGVTTTGFKARMQEQQANSQAHGTETIGYIAWKPGSGVINGRAYQVGMTGAVVNHNFTFISFSGFTTLPAFLADMQTFNGDDPCNLRWQNKSETGIEVKVAEEQSYDQETTHYNAENVGHLAIECSVCGPPPPPGTEAVFRMTREGDVYADQAYYGEGFLAGGADIAEYINVSESVEPGDVVELDPERLGYYRKSHGPYSTLVAGVISTTPGITMGQLPENPATTSLSIPRTALNNLDLASAMSAEHQSSISLSTSLVDNLLSSPLTFSISLPQLLNYYLPSRMRTENKPLLALMGVVPVKASTESGSIQPGDLLTTSSIPGYTMRCNDPRECEGAIIGKALEPLEEGTGIIKMLVMR